MSKKKYAKLVCIDHNRKITWGADAEFLFTLQNSLLLALKEEGLLNQMQYHHAEEKLKQQRRDQANKKRGEQE